MFYEFLANIALLIRELAFLALSLRVKYKNNAEFVLEDWSHLFVHQTTRAIHPLARCSLVCAPGAWSSIVRMLGAWTAPSPVCPIPWSMLVWNRAPGAQTHGIVPWAHRRGDVLSTSGSGPLVHGFGVVFAFDAERNVELLIRT